MNIKNNIEKILLLIILMFICRSAYCQENYLSGYVISLNGDTLNGFIDYRNLEKTPNKISFKANLNNNKSEYTPLDIKGFSVVDEIYESAIIKTELTNGLETNAALNIGMDTTFLQTMIAGTKSLYYYKNDFGNELFYIKTDKTYELLVYKKYLSNQEGTNTIVQNKKYIGQLFLYLRECSDIESKLKETKYTKQSLEELFQHYYRCTQSSIKFQKKTEKISSQFGLLAGISVSNFKFGNRYFPNTKIDVSLNFAGGLFLDLVLPRNKRKWSIYNELKYISFNENGQYTVSESAEVFEITHMKNTYSYLTLINALRYKYLFQKFFIYFNIGFVNAFETSESTDRIIESTYHTIKNVEEIKTSEIQNFYQQGNIFGLGSEYKKYSFEVRCENLNGFLSLPILFSCPNRFYFLMGYRF